jgi:RimJ/RimL family protein N-acetyltransferase
MTTPTIETDRLALRALRPSDAGPMTLYCSDPRVARMTTSIPHPYPPGAADAYIASSLSGRTGETVWAIDGTPVGTEELIGIIIFRPAKGEIGYWVGPPFWNTGYASEALGAVIAHVFGQGRAADLTASVQVGNDASAHVLEKAGFAEVGAGQSFSVARGELVATRLFALPRSVWAARSAVADAEGQP